MVKKRGLGKSLDALLVGSGVASATLEEAPGEERLTVLSIDAIQTGQYQPRQHMDPVALEDLARSIRAQGVIQPIVVRPIAADRYEIVAGERRWRASRLAGCETIPAIVRDIPNESAVAIALIENIQRENLNPIEEAAALQRLLNEFSMTHQQVAEAVGKSRTTVSNLLRLLALPGTVRHLLETGEIEMGHARALLTLPESIQQEAAHRIVQKGLSVRETEDMVRRLQASAASPSKKKATDPDIRRLQDDLASRLGLGVAIRCNAKGKGQVVIRYQSLLELDNILGYFQS